MEKYSHDSFNSFVADLEPNPDDIDLIQQLVENESLRQSLIDWISMTTHERMQNMPKLTPDNLFDIVLQLKGAELLDIYCLGFTAGRYYEKRERDDFNRAVGGGTGTGV